MTPSPTRLTPWNAVFADARFAAALFPALEEQAQARDGSTSFDTFLVLPAAGRLVHFLESGEDAEHVEMTPDAARRYGRLAWHAWHFWRSGLHMLPLGEDATRALIEDGPAIGPRPLRPPVSAGYVQLARNLLWARVEPGAHGEPVDGFFWVHARAGGAALAERLDVLLVLGLREDRPGLSVIEAVGIGPGPDGHWGDVEARAEGPDFGNILPGGELDRLHGLVNTAEALKLASRALLTLASEPDGEGK